MITTKELAAPHLHYEVTGQTSKEHFTSNNLGVCWLICPEPYFVKSGSFNKSSFHEAGDFITSLSNLPEESVIYNEHVSGRLHTFNPVQHIHIDGDVVTNYNGRGLSSQTVGLASGNNFYTGGRELPIGSPGQEFHCETQSTTANYGDDYQYACSLQNIVLADGKQAYVLVILSVTMPYKNGTGAIYGIPQGINITIRGFSADIMGAVSKHETGCNTYYYQASAVSNRVWSGRPKIASGSKKDTCRRWWAQERDWAEAHLEDVIRYCGIKTAGWSQRYVDFNTQTVSGSKGLKPDLGYKADLSKLKEFDCRTLLVEPDDPLLMNKLCTRALDSLPRCSNNGIAYVKEIPEQLPTVIGLVKSLNSVPSKKVKAVAASYLAMHYGIRLTIADTREYYTQLTEGKEYGLHRVQAVENFSPGLRPGVQEIKSCTARYQIFYDTGKVLDDNKEIFADLFDTDLSLENAWDMVPYSFVVDWFTKFSDLLSAIDNKYLMQTRYTTAAAGQSCRCEMILDPNHFGLDPSLTHLSCTSYERIYRKHVLDPCPGDSRTTNPLHHWVEGAALIVSNKN